MLCSYGCGKEGKYKLANGKSCCEIHHSKCTEVRKKNKQGNKGRKNPMSFETRKKLSLGATERFKNKEYRQKMKKSIRNRKIKIVEIEKSFMKCSYGCGNFARYFFYKIKKWCCSSHYQKCPHVHKKSILNQKPIPIKNKIKKCSYGCEQIARYKIPKIEKYCCSKNWAKCPEIKKKNSKTNSIKQKGKNNARFGVTVSDETRKKIRISYIKDMQNKHGQIFPNYNKNACKLIKEYGKKFGYNFQHAENGREYFINELGYWVDGYDKVKNVVIEVDEKAHFDSDFNLIENDLRRQKEIEDLLGCKFIRIKNF